MSTSSGTSITLPPIFQVSLATKKTGNTAGTASQGAWTATERVSPVELARPSMYQPSLLLAVATPSAGVPPENVTTSSQAASSSTFARKSKRPGTDSYVAGGETGPTTNSSSAHIAEDQSRKSESGGTNDALYSTETAPISTLHRSTELVTSSQLSYSSRPTPAEALPRVNSSEAVSAPESMTPEVSSSPTAGSNSSNNSSVSSSSSSQTDVAESQFHNSTGLLPSPTPHAINPSTEAPTKDLGQPAYHCSQPPSADLPGCSFADGFLLPSVLTATPSIAVILPNRFTAAIRTYWSGWRGDITNYHFEYYPMQINRHSNKLGLGAGPIFELDFVTAPRRPFTVHLPQGIYSFVLTVITAGNHTQKARQLVLVADYSAARLEKNRSRPVSVSSLTHPPWKNSLSSLKVSWRGHFLNRFISKYPYYLLPVEGIPGMLAKYDQTFGQLSVHGTPNVHGVTSFAFVICSLFQGKQTCRNGSPQPRLTPSASLSYPELFVTGSVLDVTIYAVGVLGGSTSSSVKVYVDLTPPMVQNVSLYSGVTALLLADQTKLRDTHVFSNQSLVSSHDLLLLVFSAVDEESGIDGVGGLALQHNSSDTAVDFQVPIDFNSVGKVRHGYLLSAYNAFDL